MFLHCFQYGFKLYLTSFFFIGGPSAEEARAIREAVANATTLEEVERLNQMLKAGIVPGKSSRDTKRNGTSNNGIYQNRL